MVLLHSLSAFLKIGPILIRIRTKQNLTKWTPLTGVTLDSLLSGRKVRETKTEIFVIRLARDFHARKVLTVISICIQLFNFFDCYIKIFNFSYEFNIPFNERVRYYSI